MYYIKSNSQQISIQSKSHHETGKRENDTTGLYETS